jgi:hypothetical protein
MKWMMRILFLLLLGFSASARAEHRGSCIAGTPAAQQTFLMYDPNPELRDEDTNQKLPFPPRTQAEFLRREPVVGEIHCIKYIPSNSAGNSLKLWSQECFSFFGIHYCSSVFHDIRFNLATTANAELLHRILVRESIKYELIFPKGPYGLSGIVSPTVGENQILVREPVTGKITPLPKFLKEYSAAVYPCATCERKPPL